MINLFETLCNIRPNLGPYATGVYRITSPHNYCCLDIISRYKIGSLLSKTTQYTVVIASMVSMSTIKHINSITNCHDQPRTHQYTMLHSKFSVPMVTVHWLQLRVDVPRFVLLIEARSHQFRDTKEKNVGIPKDSAASHAPKL